MRRERMNNNTTKERKEGRLQEKTPLDLLQLLIVFKGTVFFIARLLRLVLTVAVLMLDRSDVTAGTTHHKGVQARR